MNIETYKKYIYIILLLISIRYGGRHTVTVMPGDGIGPEMMGFVKEIFRHAGNFIQF